MVLNNSLPGGAKPRNVPISATFANSRINLEPGFGIGLPSAIKFGRVYLPSSGLARPLRTKPMMGNDRGSGSDMEISSGSDNDLSATSTEISYTQTSEGYYEETTVIEDVVSRGFQKEKLSSYDTPSASPLPYSRPMINQYESFNDPPTINNGSRDTVRTSAGLEVNLPAFQPRLASEQGTWCAVVSYEACVRLCLHAWSFNRSSEVHSFLENECALLRDAFGVRNLLLQSEDELLQKRSIELVSQKAAQKPRKTSGKIKLKLRKVEFHSDRLPSCSNLQVLQLSVLKKESIQRQYSNLKLKLFSSWESIQKVRLAPQVTANGSLSDRSLAYAKAGTRYMKQVSEVLKVGATNLCSSPVTDDEVIKETYFCLTKLKSSSDEDTVRMQPGSGEEYVFFPDGLGDNLVIDVQDSKGHSYGQVQVQVAATADKPDENPQWWPIYSDAEHEYVGRIQLYTNYTTSPSDHPKCGIVAETIAYDYLLEVVLKLQQFNQKNLILKDPWKWLVTEFLSYYGVSDAYTKLRYLSYIMDVATPTDYCLNLVYDLLSHVLLKGNGRNTLSNQENRILGNIEDQIMDVLALVFENYKSLDESSPSGMMDIFRPASGVVAPALAPAIKLYTLLHDISSPEARLKFCRYFEVATKKRSRRHLVETDEYALSSDEGTPIDLSMSYEKMKSLILNIRNEIFTDVEIQNQNVLPSFLELPTISSSIYSMELTRRLRAFLVACPPPGPSDPVSQLVIAATDLQRDLSLWNLNPVNGGVHYKELFHWYITRWIQDKQLDLLEFCKQDNMKSCGVESQRSATPFIDEMFDRLEETINEYEIILCRWPEYICLFEKAIADVEKATFEAVEKQFNDVLSPILKDSLKNKMFGLKYVKKLSKGTVNIYMVPNELGVLLNSMRRLLDLRLPEIETLLNSWSSCFPDDRHVIGEHLNGVKVMLRAKFRSYKQAIVEKLADNTRVQSSTKLKNIIRDSKDEESDVQNRMLPLKDLLMKTIHHLDTIVEPPDFIQICRDLWERMGQDILHILEGGREKRSWYKSLRVAVSILDDIFASEMQNLRGNSLNGKDLELHGSIREVHSMLCKDPST